MEKPVYDALVLSDLHLGSQISRAREALDLLHSVRFHRLILLGDIFCDLNFRRLTKEHWNFLSHIRKLSNPRLNVRVVWVEGNHDYGLSDVMSHLVGIPVYREYIWESAGVRNVAIHGHQFDDFILKKHSFINGAASSAYLLIQKFSQKGIVIARLLDTLNTRWQRLTPKVANRAIAHAKSRKAARIFCGHTHEATTVEQDGIFYYNAGSWTNSRCTYATIMGQEVSINDYVGRIGNCDTCEKRGKTAA